MVASARIVFILVAASISCLGDPIGARPKAPSQETALAQKADRIVSGAIHAHGGAGVVVVVVEGGRIAFIRAYGYRDPAKRKPMTTRTIFPILSLSKQFTATAAGVLAEEKKLAFGQPIVSYLPSFRTLDPAIGETLTLRDFLSHRSGLPELTFLERDPRLTRRDALERLPFIEGFAPPRSTWSYSNFGYAVAGEVIERRAGMPFEQFVEARVFAPVGMRRTTYSYAVASGETDTVSGVVEAAGQRLALPMPRQSSFNAAAGGIYSDAEDMGKWMLAQLDDTATHAVTRETRAAIRRAAYALSGYDEAPERNVVGYAMGWYNEIFRGWPTVRHGGYAPGINTMMMLVPARNTGVLVMTNDDRPPFASGLALALLDTALGASGRDWLGQAMKRLPMQPVPSPEAPRPESAAPARPLTSYVGSYFHPAYGPIDVGSDQGVLTMEWAGFVTSLAPTSADAFRTLATDQTSVWAPGGAHATVTFGGASAGLIQTLRIGGLTGVGGVVFTRTAPAR